MGLFNFFKRLQGQRPEQAAPLSEDGMAQIRLRARRRLLGAVVLVLAAVIGLPLILETQPRPVAKDIDIDVRRDSAAGAVSNSPLAGVRPLADAAGNTSAAESAAPAVAIVPALPKSPALAAPVPQAPAARPVQPADNKPPAAARVATPAPVASSRAVAVVPVEPAPARTSVTAPTSARTSAAAPTSARASAAATAPARTGPATPVAPARTTTPTPSATPKPAPRPDDSARAKAALEAKPVVPAGNRFVVQVGAFEHAAAARETRGKVEKLGFKAYEQEVDAAGARRIRVRLGPYASREEAERMLQKLRASGMSASVMPL